MTDITPPVPEGRQLIQGYGGGRFRISGSVHEGSVLVFPDMTLAWHVTRFEEIVAAAMQPVLERALEIDVLIIGCGPDFRPPGAALRRHLAEAGIAVEMMDTGAACRTYNLMLTDGRRVGAALIAVE
jgi:uncharacterized protein